MPRRSLTGKQREEPKRIQRKRIKGSKMPEGTIYVGRPTMWGNPFRVGIDGDATACVEMYKKKLAGNIWTFPTQKDIQRALGGKNLACWCPPDQPCHADVLLEIANR